MTPTSIPQFRIATPSDAFQVGEVAVLGFKTQYAKIGPEFNVGEAREKDLRDFDKWSKIGTILVAELEGEVVGTIILLPSESPLCGTWEKDFWEFRMLATHPKTHGMGLGKSLVQFAEGYAQENGAKGFCIRVRAGLPHLYGFYERLGYVPDARGDQIYPDPPVQLWGRRKDF
jgi:GNAT superfamily N-acetyltransferase